MKTFRLDTSEASLEDLRSRLSSARWPDALEDQGWSLGTDPAFLRFVCEYWRERFDWQQAAERLNALPQFEATIDGESLHLVHSRSTRANATPLLLTNGWPSSIFEYVDLVPQLTDAGFHVVAPTLPGYGLSARPRRAGMNATRIAGLFGELMLRLGYERFLAHGSDMGAGVVEQLRRNHATRLLGVHFSNVYWGYPRPAEPTPAEAEYFRNIGAWQFAEGAYAMLQGTKPQTLAYALNDSPIGIAAWILEKFESWTDGGARAIGLDNLCANLSLYWLTQTIGSSCRLYAEAFRDVEARSPPAKGEVPVGVLICPNDILPAPRQWGERWLNLVHWTEAVRGGHFPAWEIPNVLTDDLRRFAATLPAAR